MKSCPTCNRTFDDTLSFCLIDGAVLSAPFDPNARRDQRPTDDVAPPTMTYPAANNISSPANPPETVSANPQAPEGGVTDDLAASGRRESAAPTMLPTQSRQASAPRAPAMKTIAAPRPEMIFDKSPAPASDSQPRATIPSARTQPTTQPVAPRAKSSSVYIIGALVAVAVLGAGTFWYIKHSKASTPPRARIEAPQPANGTKAPPAASFVETVNGSEIDMVLVKGGTFLMGSPDTDPGRDQDEGPQTEVKIQSLHLSKYEVTQAQYRAVMNSNPSSFKGDDLPVDSVSWNDAVEFCRKLSQLTGRHYRLPTEAEWEYAARAGSTGPYAGDIQAMAWYDANAAGHPHAVGQKSPNAFGLYDMNGNLWEWCQSKYKPYPYSATDGREDLQGQDVHVLRGGSFESAARGCRSSYRRRVTPKLPASGFRIVLVGS